MSFIVRLQSIYVPYILEHELDLLAQTDSASWRKLRTIFTGKDPETVEQTVSQANTIFEELSSQIFARHPELLLQRGEMRREFQGGLEYLRLLFVRYFENRVELPSISAKEVFEESDPKKLATDILRSLGIRTQPDSP